MLLTAQVNCSAILPLENEGEFPTTNNHNTHWANFFSSSPWTDSRRYVSAVAQLFRQSIIKRKYCLTWFTLLSQLNWVLNNTRKNKVIPAKFLEVTYSIMALWYYYGQLSHLGQPFQYREKFASDSMRKYKFKF